MIPAIKDFELVRGDTLDLEITIVEKDQFGNEVPKDLSNAYVFFTIKTDYSRPDKEAVYQFKGEAVNYWDSQKGVLTISIDTSGLEAKTYVYDLQIVFYFPEGKKVKTYLAGKLKLIPDVTRIDTIEESERP